MKRYRWTFTPEELRGALLMYVCKRKGLNLETAIGQVSAYSTWDYLSCMPTMSIELEADPLPEPGYREFDERGFRN